MISSEPQAGGRIEGVLPVEKEIKRKPGWHDPATVKITHVMADGTVLDSIEGIRIPDSPALREFVRLARLIAFGGPNTTKD